jgi:hypothetical protein
VGGHCCGWPCGCRPRAAQLDSKLLISV